MLSTIPIALQLYSVRENLAEDFEKTLREVAGMGYTNVETAGFPQTTAAEEAQLYQKLGLNVVSAHLPLPLGEQQQQVIETAAALGCKRIISAWLPPEQYLTVDDILRNCDRFNEAAAVAQAHGLSFGVHNHDFEFAPVPDDGRRGYDIWREALDPAIFFELDTYWIQVAGHDPAQVVREAGARAPLLHIKDGPAVRDQPMVALGQGVIDIPAILDAAGEHTEVLIVELDHCATDMMVAARESYIYLNNS